MKFDIRFVEASYELMLLGEYHKMLASSMPRLLEAEIGRIQTDFDQSDEAERQIAWHLRDRLEEGITTRFLTGSIIIASWGFYEATVQDVATYLRAQKQIKLRIADLRGDFIERAQRYFGDVLRFSLHPPGTDWDRLTKLAELRHVLAHANGGLRYIHKDKRRKLLSWVEATPGLLVAENQYVLVTLEFAAEARQFVADLLGGLITRVREQF